MPPEIAAEAAVWVARLHGPDRSWDMERECLAWQARSAVHRLAFERCTDTWQDVAGVTLRTYARATAPGLAAASRNGAGRLRPTLWAVGMVAVAMVGALVLQPWRTGEVFDTGVGEQRLVVLPDGTRMSLNTASRVNVEFAKAQRTVTVDRGEALFEVAKDARRPFVVKAAGSEVVATGTAFVVRLALAGQGGGEALDVTLVEGQVLVRGMRSGAADPNVAPAVVMAAGQRMRIGRLDPATGSQHEPELDRPRMDQVLAWQRGEAVFEDVPLREALAEMNRYSARPIVVGDGVGGLRISGVFKTGDSARFARAVAALHGLGVVERRDRLELVAK